mgnify:CR=1 FL=1
MPYKYICPHPDCNEEIKVYTLKKGDRFFNSECGSVWEVPSDAEYFDNPKNRVFHESELKDYIIAYFYRIQEAAVEQVFSFKVDKSKIMNALGAKSDSEIQIVEKELAYACKSIEHSWMLPAYGTGDQYQYYICYDEKARYEIEYNFYDERIEKQAEQKSMANIEEAKQMMDDLDKEDGEENSITGDINEAMHKYFPSKPISPIFLSTLVQAYGLDFNSDEKFIIKNSKQLADGEYKSYHHSFGLIKTQNISTIGEFENGEMKKITEYDKYGNVVNCWEQGYNLGDTSESNDDARKSTDWDDIV